MSGFGRGRGVRVLCYTGLFFFLCVGLEGEGLGNLRFTLTD